MARRPKAEIWRGGNGRWYFHRVAANGKITDDHSVQHRSSARRACRSRWPGIEIVVLDARPR